MNTKEKLKELGNRVRSVRKQQGLSQTALANKIGKDQPSINRLEMGNINPSYIYLLQVCEGLEITITDLVESIG